MSATQIYSEKELLERVAKGEEQAFANLVQLYSSRLYTYMYRITGNSYESEELVQDIFVQLWQTRETLTSVKNFGAYLYILSKNRATNALKKVIRIRNEMNRWATEQVSVSVDDDGFQEQISNLLDQAIDALPPKQQKIWRMSRMQHMKYEAIARELDISKDTVNKALQAANKNITTYVNKHLDTLLLLLLTFILEK